jgi:hypothetical protein
MTRDARVSTNLTFLSNAAQAVSVRDRWHDDPGRRVAVCLDEALFTQSDAATLLGPDVIIVGRSELGLSPELIFEETLRLAEDFFTATDQSWPARVEQWLLESHKRWLIHAVHSVRLIKAALERFHPEQIWVPDQASFSVTLSPDTDPSNPLFFDLLAWFCRHDKIRVKGAPSGLRRRLRRSLLPLKYVLGERVAAIRQRGPKSSKPGGKRPVITGNLDNDFHRQFDLGKLGPSASAMLAWVRGTESLVPVEELLGRAGLPGNTRFAWLYDGALDLALLGYPSGVKVRPWAGLHYLFKSLRYQARKRSHLRATRGNYDIPWRDLLFGADIADIHGECRVAAAYYCVFEYERARSLLLRWKPQLFVSAADHWPYLPHFAAAKDLGIKTLSTESGLSFLQDNFAQKKADIVCVFGQADAIRVADSWPQSQIVMAGDALAPRTPPTVHVRSSSLRHVLFVMSGRMFGWWFGSLIFDYPAYVKALAECLESLQDSPEHLRVVLKSHPVSDLHELYDKMVGQHGNVLVEHRREPMSDAEIASYDVAVVFGAATAFTAELIRARLPIVYFSGGLTEFGKSYFEYDGLEVADNVDEAIEKLTRVLDSQPESAREEALHKAELFLESYIDPKHRSFPSVLEEVLGYKFESALRSTSV